MPSRTTRAQVITTIVMALLILIPSMYGFVGKFVELVNVLRGDPEGAFAVAPIANYLLASLGFFCLLLWASLGGMWSDIEKPKLDMLEHERDLDATIR